MNSKRKITRVARWAMCVPLLAIMESHALSPFSHEPLFLGSGLDPNVFFTLDDSGSMQWEIMPEGEIKAAVYFMFPRADGIYGSSDYNNYSVDFDPANGYTARLRSSYNNKIYYNPQVTYLPWSNADGSLMANASTTCAPHNPANPSKGCRNLTANNTQTARWLTSSGTLSSSSSSKTFYPAVYFKYKGSGAIGSASSYTQIEIKAANAPFEGGPNRSDCAAKTTCTYTEEIQNFANWYTYYRSRILLARAGVGRAFAAQDEQMRVGFGAINKSSATIDSVLSSGTIISGVRPFSGSSRTAFFDSLYTHAIPAAGTPLRTALNQVGKYFQRTDDRGPWGEKPGSTGGTQFECRQSYHIMMSDGYWNDSFTGVGNADGTAGPAHTNHSVSAKPPTYSYAPVLPYSDSNSNTLADVAMYYWKTDLRPDLDNKVPNNTADPAFWQHLVTYTVGLGVSGSLTALPSGSGTWPNPTTDAAKIDDMWHAAVNSRGEFFSAADPVTFANALSSALKSIVSRSGSSSAVATSSSSLGSDSRVYQATFKSGEWSGQLLSIPIDKKGELGTPVWDAGAILETKTPASRVILTKKAGGDGIPFEYDELEDSQKDALDADVLGVIDGCGPERVAYLRGDDTNEGLFGDMTCASSGTVIDKFRVRTRKLGDIVASSPAYVGDPATGYHDVDYPGYKAFSGAGGYKGRTPMVYVGANDGALHGFSAKTGEELIAYVPGMVYPNLTRLTSKSFSNKHRYFVDGSPMVADVNLGSNAAPDWRTVLVGGMNGGGQGYYALDVTNPTDASKTAPTFDTANAASLVMWEFAKADDADMGYSYNYPPRHSGRSMQFARMENGVWAVIVGNGYRSDSGKAVLYVLFLKGGVDGTWTLGSDYIRLVADGVGVGNGLSTPMPFDSDGNGFVDVVYAGDLKGNLWKFDLSSKTPADWKVALSGVPLFSAGTGKPIVSPPAVTWHPQAGQLVLFGTGKYLELADVNDASPQTMYGIWDNGSVVVASELVQQKVVTDGVVRTVSQNDVKYSVTAPLKVKGWYLNLPTSRERHTGVPDLKDGRFLFTTSIPSTEFCDGGGDGFLYLVDYLTGGMLDYPAFDINGDGAIDAEDGPAAAVKTAFAPGGVTGISGDKFELILSSPADGSVPTGTEIAGGTEDPGKRISWRELLDINE